MANSVRDGFPVDDSAEGLVKQVRESAQYAATDDSTRAIAELFITNLLQGTMPEQNFKVGMYHLLNLQL